MNEQAKEKLVENQDKLSSIWLRVRAASPAFFKKLRWVLVSIAAGCTGVLAMKELPDYLQPDQYIFDVAKHGLTASAAATFVTFFSVSWSKLKEEEN